MRSVDWLLLMRAVLHAETRGVFTNGQFSRRSRIPAESVLSFGFSCPHLWGPGTVKQVDVKWGARFDGTQLNVTQYYNSYCAPAMTTNFVNRGITLKSPEKQEQQHYQQQIPSEDLPEPAKAKEYAIDKVVKEFKALPDWLEIILGPADNDKSSIKWTDETDEGVLRAQAARILRAMPVFESTPKLPIFEPPEVFELQSSRFIAKAQAYQVLRLSPLGVHAILLGDNSTGVIIIPTFKPGEDATVKAQFHASLIEAIVVLRPMAEKLILDLSRNGGGDIGLSRWALELFFPETPPTITNFRYSDLGAMLVETDSAPSGARSTVTGGSVADKAYLSSTISHPNRRFSFTNYFTDDCAQLPYGKLPVETTEESNRPRAVKKVFVYDANAVYHPWDAEDIIIFDEGTCGSACATFANQLHQKNKVKTAVVASGRNKDPISFSAFPGGQVLNLDVYNDLRKHLMSQALSDTIVNDQLQHGAAANRLEEQQQALNTRQDDGTVHSQATFTNTQAGDIVKLLPEPLQHKAKFTCTWRQTYNNGDAQVLFTTNGDGQAVPNWPNLAWTEYSFLPADFRIPYKSIDFESYHNMWERARDVAWPNTTP
ncbi:hypothetical protein BGZ67_004725 [Mortierella alpina]|nr:hypothetical protein BGZ67_004725 [Mortierella alpina]